MMVSTGDKVRVLRHRNTADNDLNPVSGMVGDIITLEKEFREVYDGFKLFGVKDSPWVIRSDDIEPVSEGPIRTVSRREIVPGVYGSIYVGGVQYKDVVALQFFERDPKAPMNLLTSASLREAAHLFNQLAEVLDENHRS